MKITRSKARVACLVAATAWLTGCSASTAATATKRTEAPPAMRPRTGNDIDPEGTSSSPAPVVDPQSAPGPVASNTVALGHASVEFGARPPWAPSPRGEESSDEPEQGNPKPPSPRWHLMRTIWVGRGYLHEAELSRDGTRVLTLSEQEGVLRSYDVGSGKLRRRIPIPDFAEFDSVGFATIDERHETVLLVRDPFRPPAGNPAEIPAQLVNMANGAFTPVPSFPSGDGLRFARPDLLGLSDRVIEPQSGILSFWWASVRTAEDGSPSLHAELAARLTCAERPDDWALSADGKLLAIAYYPSNTVELLDLEQREVRLKLQAPQWGGSVALSPSNTLLAVGGAELRLHALPSGELLATDSGYENNIDTIRFTPTGDLLLTSAYDRKARSYPLAGHPPESHTLPAPQALPHTGSNVYALALTPDGRRLVTSSGDQTLKVWIR